MGNKASHFKNKECEYFKKMFLAYLEIGKCYEDSGDCQAAYGYYLMGLRILVEVEKTATRMNVHNLSEIKQARREHVQFLKKMIDEKGVTNPFGRTPNLRNTDKYEPVSESYLSNFHARIKMAKRNMRMKDKKVLQSITSCILMKRPTTTWDNIIGLEREKEALQVIKLITSGQTQLADFSNFYFFTFCRRDCRTFQARSIKSLCNLVELKTGLEPFFLGHQAAARQR